MDMDNGMGLDYGRGRWGEMEEGEGRKTGTAKDYEWEENF